MFETKIRYGRLVGETGNVGFKLAKQGKCGSLTLKLEIVCWMILPKNILEGVGWEISVTLRIVLL